MANFHLAFNFLLPWEGGYANDKADPGGETKYGLSHRSYPSVDIANLSLEDAKKIYERDFWAPQRYCDFNSQEIANRVFGFSVNMGCHQAHIILQRALGDCGSVIVADGKIGDLTLAAVNQTNEKLLLEALRYRARNFYYKLATEKPSNEKFLHGWIKRAEA